MSQTDKTATGKKYNMVRAISENGGVVICALDSTEMVSQMERYHKTSATASAALGRLLTAASLMGVMMKSPDDSLTLRVNGGGPLGALLAVSDGDGNVRGYVDHPLVELPPRADGKLDVGGGVGKDGTLAVIRDLGLKEPYVGQVPLVSGEIAEDITSYYAASEQTPSVCALGVVVDKDLSIRAAGGFLLQLLPGATDAEITMLEENIAKIPSVTALLEGGGTIYDMVETTLAGFSPNILDESNVRYRCYCSRQRTQDILVGLGREELEKMRQENPEVTVECHFCDKKYTFELAQLLPLTQKATRDES